MRLLSIMVILFVITECYHLFDPSLRKGFLFFYALIIALGYFISAIGMWKLSKWSIYLFIATTIALIPGFIYLNTIDLRVVFLSLIVLIATLLNWKNLT
ncbi:MAG: hypothetical protein IPH84_08655 [Bacteroidales bacterium]|nr:hypothetical protein [Bacteroidales bacterium]